ncbi:hypothetical protein [Streptomyces sp. NPDC020996]|uniref:hypothetical protein n=1 Tax=Streptomyces sp. NPDC020996 TaxID=3154791 RepID=UPI0033FC5BFB
MAEHATHATVLRPVPLRELPACRRLAVAAPGSALILLGAALRVVLRTDRDGIGVLGGVLIVVLLVLAAAGWLGLYVRQRSRNQRLTYADGRLTVTDRRGRSTSVRPVEAVAHGVRGFIGQSVLLVVSGAEGEAPLLLRLEHWDWRYLQDRVLRPAGVVIDVRSDRQSTARDLRAAHPGVRLPFSLAHPHLLTLLLTVGILALITAVVVAVSLPYLLSGSGS